MYSSRKSGRESSIVKGKRLLVSGGTSISERRAIFLVFASSSRSLVRYLLFRLFLCLRFTNLRPPIDRRLATCISLVSEAPPPKKTRGELAREADPFYYGFRDDEDQTLVPIEREAEQKGAIPLNEWIYPYSICDFFHSSSHR